MVSAFYRQRHPIALYGTVSAISDRVATSAARQNCQYALRLSFPISRAAIDTASTVVRTRLIKRAALHLGGCNSKSH